MANKKETITLMEEELASLLAGKTIDLIETDGMTYRLKISKDSPMLSANPKGYKPFKLHQLRIGILFRYFDEEYFIPEDE